MKNRAISILLIEDNPGDARLIREMLSEAGGSRFDLKVVGRLSDGLGHLKQEAVGVVLDDVVLLDLGLPDSQGIHTLLKVHEQAPSLPIVVLTGLSDEELALRAVKLGAQDYLVKSQINGNLLLHAIYYAFERKRLEQELREKKEQLETQNERLQATREELCSSNEELQATNDELQREVAERKQAEEAIEQVAEEWRTTFDAITSLISIHDRNFRITRLNKAFANNFGVKPAELIGKYCWQIVHGTDGPSEMCPHQKTLKTGEPATVEYFEPHLGIYLEVATSPIFDSRGEVIASVHVARDVTGRKKMDEQLIITDRLASVGELAAGIAHELNNPLTSVIGFSQLLLDKDIADDIREDLKIISSEAQRAASVVKNLLTFARKHAPEKQPVNINDVVEKILEMRAYEQRVNNIRVETRLAANLPEVMADYFQLQQVFINIIINAEHFMLEAHNKGCLTITTEKVDKVVKALFADDGPGISKENLGRLFVPFFTTKPVGRGTGLGLSICHGIITQHGGRIYVESELGKGATFAVELPIS